MISKSCKLFIPIALATIFCFYGTANNTVAEASSSLEEFSILEDDFSSQSLIQSRMTLWGVSTTGGVTNTIQAHFTPSAKVSTTSWGLIPYQYVNQAYVRLTEGTYDSGRKYSALATDKNDSTTFYTPKVSKTNNILYQAKSSWNWFYFK